MKKILLITSVLLAAACAGSSPPPSPDAALKTNVPFGGMCTVVSDMSTECTTGVCTNTFDTLGYSVCSQKCTVLMGTDPTCPMGPSAQKCNMKGYCKP